MDPGFINMHNYANQCTIKLQLSPRDAVFQYWRRLSERGHAGISASPVFNTLLKGDRDLCQVKEQTLDRRGSVVGRLVLGVFY